jgi:hypothetical protein
MGLGDHTISCTRDLPLRITAVHICLEYSRAGRDAARAFATGCFAAHRAYDIRGLTEKQMHVR